MFNFTYHNPVKVLFGKGMISELSHLIPKTSKVLILYGGGSIKKNGVYEQVIQALKEHKIFEFSGIEPNPYYETLMKAVELGKKEQVDFLLAVGGGSVADGTKFIAAAMEYSLGDPWDILAKGAAVGKAVPLGCVLTLPATGSEMNGNSVVSKKSTQEKLFFNSPLVYPQFSILDPETTFTLPVRQTVNGIVDSFVHVAEQYFTYNVNTPLQDRQSEAILETLIEESPKVLKNPQDYASRANIMWCATQALNGLIGCGVAQDWATHMIGHEITALHGLDHAQTLAIVLPSILKYQRTSKKQKLAQFAQRVFHVLLGQEEEESIQSIQKIEEFFQSLGIATKLSQYKIGSENFEEIANRLEKRGMKLGEHQNICKKEVLEILQLSL
ncbi:MAG: iron-containing alcohol dehydrogenase [Candidatus Brocadiae bacterium]|nr:iron-containing alcohol dehydrogenase [Candidatus Brocadiia bacterium]